MTARGYNPIPGQINGFVNSINLPLKPLYLNPFPNVLDEFDARFQEPVLITLKSAQKYFIPSQSVVAQEAVAAALWSHNHQVLLIGWVIGHVIVQNSWLVEAAMVLLHKAVILGYSDKNVYLQRNMWATMWEDMSQCLTKPTMRPYDQQRLRSACTSTQYAKGYHLSLFGLPRGCRRHVISQDSDQTAHMCRLVWVCAGLTILIVGFEDSDHLEQLC